MIKNLLFCFFLLICFVAKAQDASLDKPEFWQNIVANDYQVPASYQVDELVSVLQKHLGNSDPLWRDQLAYSITAAWIQSGVLNENAIRKLMPAWINAAENIQNPNPLARSFGILSLDLVAVFNQRKPFLKKHEIDRLWKIAVNGIMQPRDWRGWDEKVGWVHITAHSADLIKTLATHTDLELEQQNDFFDAVETSINSAPQVFVHAEMERLSDAIIVLQQRDDFSGAAWASLLKRLSSLEQGFEGINPQMPQYAIKRNANQFLAFVSWKSSQ